MRSREKADPVVYDSLPRLPKDLRYKKVASKRYMLVWWDPRKAEERRPPKIFQNF